jgi:hypothetical protein
MSFRVRALPPLVIGLLAILPANAGLAAAVRGFDGADSSMPPAKLSQTGLYTTLDRANRAIADGIVPFQVNTALWSDAAAKERYVSLPAGAKISPTDTDTYAYPEGTVFIKNFMIDTIYGDSASRILVETRFLVRHAGASPEDNPWHGITYKWARNQSDADLVDRDMGENVILNVIQNGSARGKRWTYPSMHQCNTCHHNRGILGFITPQLNRPSAANPALNQLQSLKDLGVLDANPIAGHPDAFRWAGLKDTGASLETRARSYFGANCSHCHGNGPPGTSPGDHVFDFFHPERSIEQGPEGANGAYIGKITHQGGDAFPQFIYKGYPESSYVLKRMMVRQDFDFTPTEQMPTLATFQPDSAALNLLKDWICSMGNRPVSECRLPQVQSDDRYWDSPASAVRVPRKPDRAAPPSLRRGILHVTPGSVPSGGLPGLFDFRGRAIPLADEGRGDYRVLSRLRPGLYLVRAGSSMRTLHYLP